MYNGSKKLKVNKKENTREKGWNSPIQKSKQINELSKDTVHIVLMSFDNNLYVFNCLFYCVVCSEWLFLNWTKE